MLSILRTAFLLFLAATVAVAAWGWQRVDEGEVDVSYRGYISQAHELDARVHLEVLKTHKGLVSSYDPLVTLLRQLSHLAEALASPPGFLADDDRAAIVSEAEKYRLLLGQQRELVESFKTHNAVLRSSVRYFPMGSQQLADHLAERPESSHRAADLSELIGSVLLVTAFRDQELPPRAAVQVAEFRDETFADMSPADVDTLEHLLAHASVIVDRKPKVDRVVAEILALPTSLRLDALMRGYASAHDAAAQTSRRLRSALFVLVLCTVLLGAAYVITRLGRSRSALATAKATLETALGELRVEQEKQRELSELKNRFVSMASHEFRTPLSVILSSVNLLEAYGSRWTEDKRKGHLGRVQEAAKGMKAMLDEVLLIGRSEAGGFDCKPVPTDVAKLAASILDDVRTSVGGDHRFALEAEGDLTALTVDPRLVEHALGNLLTNAVKYSPPESTVTLSVTSNHVLTFVVADEGIGIEDDDLPRLFDSFYRGRNVGKVGGTGLGLAIAKKAIEAHGGSIEVASEVDQGTRFTVRIALEGER